MITQLFVQVIYILFPMLIYFTIVKNNHSLENHKSFIIGLLTSFSIYFCMSFPISFITGNIMDLRTIPWIFSFLYGGFHVGIIVTAFMFIFRAFIGGAGMYVVFIAYSLTILLIYFSYRNYLALPYWKRLKAALGITLFNTTLVILSIQSIFQFSIEQVIGFYLFFIMLHLCTMWFLVYLIEIFNENERLPLELQKSEKLKVVGQMAASVAHEIRNPMTTVSGFIQILSRDEETPEKHKEHLRIMGLELSRAESIISEYLSLAKPEAEKLDLIDVQHEVKRINKSISAYALMHGVNLDFQVTEKEPYYVKGSSEKIQQVLMNIIKNAIEASPKDTTVILSVLKCDKTIKISIKDVGIGMNKEEIDQIGTPFYSLKENGTGLGLTVCYSIIHSMGGRIAVKSKKNQGTTFTIFVPEGK